MAWMRIDVRPGAGVQAYSVFVDGIPVTMGSTHRGEARCEGRSGDGSRHSLLYSFNGAPGASLSISLWCGGREACRLRDARIEETGRPWGAGRRTFEI